MEDRKKIEAVLFAVGDKIEEEEVARLTRLPLASVQEELRRLKEDYNQANSTFIVLNEGSKWKLTVREDYMPIVQKIVPKTELSRPVLETLAVIAWKSPVLQSNIVDIRSSKAYDHIAELEEVGFITKQKYGRSFMLRLSQQFFEYFDVKGKEGIKDIFKDIKGAEQISSPDKKLQDFESSGKGEEAENKEGKKENLPAEAPLNLPTAKTPEPSLPVAQPGQGEIQPMVQEEPNALSPTTISKPKREKKPKQPEA